MPSVEQMAQLCTLVGHLNQFQLTEGRIRSINNHMENEPHAVPLKTVLSEGSGMITDTITRIIGFVHRESIVEGDWFRKALSECEQNLVQRIEVLQQEFSQVEAISVTVTPEEPPSSWLLRLIRPRYTMTDKPGNASQD